MKQPLENRILQIVSEVSNGHFPTYNQLKIMLKAEGYSPLDIDRWFATQASEFLEGVENSRIQDILHNDVYLIVDHDTKVPLAFWTEGQAGVLPLDTANPDSWRAANELRNSLKNEGFISCNK